MSRKLLTALSVILVSTILTASAFSWGPGSHLYIAKRIAEELDHYQWGYLGLQNMYGAMAPDLNSVAPIEIQSELRHATHYDFQPVVDEAYRLSQRAFAAGWTTHNEDWGADYYAHRFHPVHLTTPGYVKDEKNLALVEVIKNELWPPGECPLTDEELMSGAELYIEAGVDLLLEEHDEYLGRKATRAASKRDSTIPSLLGRAYPGFVGEGLLAAEAVFRVGIIAYGEIIALPRPKDEQAIASSVAVLAELLYEIEVTPEQSLYFLRTAMDLCSGAEDNYFSAIEASINLIIDQMGFKLAPARPEPKPNPAVLWGEIKRAQ